MELKAGYKQTEVGLIPEDWNAKPMGSLTSLMTNGFVGTVTNDYVDSEDGVLYVQGYNVEENSFNFHGIKRVSKAFHAKNQKSCLRAGDLLTIQTGDIGVTTIVPPSLTGANCHALVISRFDQRTSEPGFYCQYFNSERGRVAFKEIETGSTMKHLNVGDMVKLFVPSPPVAEQRAIATALSDVDALLSKLHQLIVKKRDLKQAAMQKLLTGHTRLPGFSGEWEVKQLGELLTYEQPTKYLVSSSEYSDSNDVPVLTAGKTFILGFTRETEGIFADLPVIIFDDFTTATKYVNFPFKAKSSAMKILKPRNPSVNLRLVYETMQLIDFKLGDHKRYWISEYSKLEIRIPESAEQTAIATVLADMDAELAALEARRDKTCALKQGMMQELLTGRIRLV
jgi:type I restriction enzyme S subunit